jgi:hypothetical protein
MAGLVKLGARLLRILDLSRAGSRIVLIAAATLLTGGCKCKLVPWALAVDPSLSGNSDADGVLEPFETVIVKPSWQQKVTGACTRTGSETFKCDYGPGEFGCNTTLDETGAPISLTGPAPGAYAVQDSLSPYGTIGKGATKTGGYAVFVSAPAGRPAPHWDAAFTETLAGNRAASTTWTIHVGDSFWDVPRSHPFYTKIETLFHNGITAGCAPGGFCPDGTVTRAEIAMFLGRSLSKNGLPIRDSGTLGNRTYNCVAGGVSLFQDVSPTDAFCKHVHYLAGRRVLPVCQPSLQCPSSLITRSEMVEIVARALVAPLGDNGVPVTYGPDPSTGRSYSCNRDNPDSHFEDVGPMSFACPHANYLWARGIIAGCGPDAFCPDGDVARGEMAKFLVNAFQLKLYGP